jgi:DNA-binding LacI/PurR family transcriptional regulator
MDRSALTAAEARRGSRRPTLYDVAERAGVSIATVSFAFRQPDRVRKSTLDSVLAAASALGYVPSANARGLATGRTGAIGLYSFDYLPEPAPAPAGGPDLRRFPLYVDEVQYGVEVECRQRGYAVMLGSGRKPGHLPAVIDIAGRVDGLIALAGSAPPEAIVQVSKRIPVVELGGEAHCEGVQPVLVDNRGGMRVLTAHLVEAHDLRHFAYLGVRDTAEFAARYQGFADALSAAGRPVPAPEPERSHPADPASTAAAVARRFRAGNLPEVFVCATDQEALVVIDSLLAAGSAVPERVAVTGFDGILAGQVATPRLTTVRQPMAEIGRRAVQILAGILDGTERAGPAYGQFPCAFVPGASCGCDPASEGRPDS